MVFFLEGFLAQSGRVIYLPFFLSVFTSHAFSVSSSAGCFPDSWSVQIVRLSRSNCMINVESL